MLQRSEPNGAGPSISATEASCSENFRPVLQGKFFAALAQFLWPDKTAMELAARTNTSERMCRYWLAGTHPPTWKAVRVVLGEVMRRLD